jgi:hypothetical protein
VKAPLPAVVTVMVWRSIISPAEKLRFGNMGKFRRVVALPR